MLYLWKVLLLFQNHLKDFQKAIVGSVFGLCDRDFIYMGLQIMACKIAGAGWGGKSSIGFPIIQESPNLTNPSLINPDLH